MNKVFKDTIGRAARRGMRVQLLFWSGVVASFLAASTYANAEITNRDLQVMARALSFLDPPFSGQKRMGIVYDPGNTLSTEQAQSVRSMMGAGLRAGNLTLTPVLVPVGQLRSANVDFFFLTEFLGESARQIAIAVNARELLCVSTDVSQVQAGVCAVGVRSAPKVEILLNRQAASSSGMKFSAVFRMMVKEL